MKTVVISGFFLFVFSSVVAQETNYLYNKNGMWESGSRRGDVAWNEKRSVKQSPHNEDMGFKRNTISLNVLDLMLKNISFSIEFIPGNGKTSIVMPLTFYSPLGKAIEKFNNSDMGKYHQSLATYIRAGFEFNYYPYGQRKYSYFTGVSVLGSYMKRDVDVQVDEGQGVVQGLYFYFMNKQGIAMTFKERLCVTLAISAGIKTPDVQHFYFGMLGNVGVGVKF